MTKRSTDKGNHAKRGRSASNARAGASVALTAPPREPPLVKRAALVAAGALLAGCAPMGPVMTPGVDRFVTPDDATDVTPHPMIDAFVEDRPVIAPMPPPPMIDVTEPPNDVADVTPRPMVDAFVEDRPVIAPMPPPRDE